MIQVLERAFGVLAILSQDAPLTLAELTERTGLKKPTLCLILKSLVDLGVVRKIDTGVYATAAGLERLARRPRRNSLIREVAEEAVGRLATDLRESVVAAQIHKGVRYTVAQATFAQALMVDTTLQARGTFYSSATGRVLLAYMSEEDAAATVARHGLPSSDIWPEATTPEGMRCELARIRKDGEVVLAVAGGAVQFVGVPVFGPDGCAWFSLGVSLPSVRFVPPHDKAVLSGLHRVASELADHLDLVEGDTP